MGAAPREVKNIDYDGSAWGGWAFGQEFDSPHLHQNKRIRTLRNMVQRRICDQHRNTAEVISPLRYFLLYVSV